MFYLRKINYCQVDCIILELFYKAGLLSFGLDKLQRLVKTTRKIIGCSQTSVPQLLSDLIVSNAEQILKDPSHPLYIGGSNSRLLQRSIKTKRFSVICPLCYWTF